MSIMSYFERLSMGEEVVKGEVRGVALLHSKEVLLKSMFQNSGQQQL